MVHKPVPVVQLPVPEAEAVDHPVAVERLIESVAGHVHESRSVPEQGARQIRGNRALYEGLWHPVVVFIALTAVATEKAAHHLICRAWGVIGLSAGIILMLYGVRWLRVANSLDCRMAVFLSIFF